MGCTKRAAARSVLPAAFVFLTTAFLGAPGVCDDQALSQQFTEEINDAGKDKVVTGRTETPPSIDGLLDEECWKSAARLTTFRIANQPGQGMLAQQQTEVLVTADRQSLYFAFICRDSGMASVAAHQTQYDGSLALDDYVTVGLDTFRDRTRSYLFHVNPLGTRRDERWNDDRWNAPWKAAAKIGHDAWTVEMEIPYSILVMPGNARAFGLNCARWLQRKNEWSIWKYTKNYSEREFTWAELSGFEAGDARRPDRYVGYVVGSRRFEEPGSTAAHAGFDWEHPITSTTTGALAINPDWSNIETAHAGIDFTYVERFFDEVRPFFSESQPYLPTDTLFYPQRRVFKFDQGLKLTGTEGRLRFGVLGMMGVERFADVPREDDLVARLWYNFNPETYVNFSDVRTSTDNSTHIEFVHDRKGRIRARTDIEYFQQSSDEPGLGGSISHVRSYAENEHWYLGFGYDNIGDNIQPELGRLPRRGISQVELEGAWYVNPRPGSTWFERSSIGMEHTRADDHRGGLSFEESGILLQVQQSARLSFDVGPTLYRHPGATREPFDDLTWTAAVRLYERQPTNAYVNATAGVVEESSYRYFSLGGAARTKGDRFAGSATFEWTRWGRRNALSLHGSEENAHQYGLWLTYRPVNDTWFSISQRWLRQSSGSRSIFNAILRKQYGVDHDLYVIYGDPQNPDDTVTQITVKYVMPFGGWGDR